MFYLNWRFTLIALSVAPLLFAVTYSYTRRSKKASREVRKKESEIVSRLQEVLSSIGVVKALAREDYEQRRLEEESAQSVQIALRARSLKARLSPLVGLIVAVGTALVLWFGGKLVLAGSLSAGSLIVFIWYLGKMYKPMQDFAKMTDTYSKAAVGYERIREVFDTEPQVRDLPSALPGASFQGRDRVRSCLLQLHSRPTSAEGHQLQDRTRPNDGPGRTDRRRQNHHRQLDRPFLRSRFRVRQDRRTGRARLSCRSRCATR